MSDFLQQRRGLIGFALLLFLMFTALGISFQQRWLVFFHMNDSQAMWPTIQTGDLVLGETVSRRFFEPSPGQMIIFDSAGISGLEELHGQDPPWLYVQRLVAVPGDQIRIAHGEVSVNEVIWEPVQWYGQIDSGPFLREFETMEVPPASYFVIADHYSVGEDSRFWGWVPRENLVARVLWIFRTSE